jgi:hypothetical protein
MEEVRSALMKYREIDLAGKIEARPASGTFRYKFGIALFVHSLVLDSRKIKGLNIRDVYFHRVADINILEVAKDRVIRNSGRVYLDDKIIF